jgi:hypothetical protein
MKGHDAARTGVQEGGYVYRNTDGRGVRCGGGSAAQAGRPGGGDKNKERGGVGKYERKVGREAGDKDIGREGIQQGDACGNRWRLHRMKGHDAARTGVH